MRDVFNRIQPLSALDPLSERCDNLRKWSSEEALVFAELGSFLDPFYHPRHSPR